ncbi:MAG: indolepyruvate oxidoreductase subunit beta [Bacillota bacterium]|nr:indolepyruvate oxidoreductase subunit beta [Bacillota bacterium]
MTTVNAASSARQAKVSCLDLDNFVIASVGGQGGLLATKVLAAVLHRGGMEVKTSEVHGMAQRGGSVISFVRRAPRVWSPVIDAGDADAILGLELLEAARALPYLRMGGVVVTSTQQITPVTVSTGQARYPADLTERLRASSGRTVLVPAGDIAAELGQPRVANVVCLGALSVFTDQPADIWEQVIAAAVPARTVALNLEAFRRGRAVSGM